MKTHHISRFPQWIVAFCAGLSVQAQDLRVKPEGQVDIRTAGRSTHQRILEVVSSQSADDGSILSTTNSIIELATGLHYRDERGEWQETEEAFEVVPGSARAWKGNHRVTLASNPNTVAAVRHRLPDGRLLSSHRSPQRFQGGQPAHPDGDSISQGADELGRQVDHRPQ